jgi:hypothetical protein
MRHVAHHQSGHGGVTVTAVGATTGQVLREASKQQTAGLGSVLCLRVQGQLESKDTRSAPVAVRFLGLLASTRQHVPSTDLCSPAKHVHD